MAGIRERYQWRRMLALAGAASYEFSEADSGDRQSFFDGDQNLGASLRCLNLEHCLGCPAYRGKAGVASESAQSLAGEKACWIVLRGEEDKRRVTGDTE